MTKYALRGHGGTIHLTGWTEQDTGRKIWLNSVTAKSASAELLQVRAGLETLLQNATSAADLQEWDDTSERLAL